MTLHPHATRSGPEPWLSVGRYQLFSRLLVGIELYTDPGTIRDVLLAAQVDALIATIDVQQRRTAIPLQALAEQLDLTSYTWLGTTSFAQSPEQAVEIARGLRRGLGIELIKLDVRDSANQPDREGTLLATRLLLADGFHLMPLIQPHVATALTLRELGCCAIRLLAAPVASRRGIVDPGAITACIEAVGGPVVVEGGLGSPAHIIQAIELGATAVLVNTMVAEAAHQAGMAAAARLALLAGRLAVAARRPPAPGERAAPAVSPHRALRPEPRGSGPGSPAAGADPHDAG